MKIYSFVLVALCLVVAPITLFAQVPWNQSIESPVLRLGRQVTFRLEAPQAKKVEISAQFLKGNQQLQKDSSGVWSITLGPIDPYIYPYNFISKISFKRTKL